MLSSVQSEIPENASRRDDWDAIRAALQRYLRARGAAPDLVEDLAQETLARLVELARTQQIGSMLALGFRIADNLRVDLYRRESRSRPSTWCKFGCGQRAALSGGLGCNL